MPERRDKDDYKAGKGARNYMKIFVATYEDGGGGGQQKIFETRKEAMNWLRERHSKDFAEDECSFIEWKNHGTWTAKVKAFSI